MKIWASGGLALAAWLVAAGGPAPAQQVLERETKITGPRGRSIEREVRSERGPGYVRRDVKIERPGGTFERQTQIGAVPVAPVRGPRPAGFGGYGHGHGYGYGPRVVERDYIVQRNVFVPAPAPRPFVAAPFFSLFLGGAAAVPPPPPPVVVVPQPVYAAPPPVVVAEPVPVATPQPAPALDPFADALGRLKSHHDNSRRDGAKTLGRLGDPRGVPALVDRLQNDREEEVRVASAWALGQIGDARALPYLDYAARYDRKKDVREAAGQSYNEIPRTPYPANAPPPPPPLEPGPEVPSLSAAAPPATAPAYDPLPPPPPRPDPAPR